MQPSDKQMHLQSELCRYAESVQHLSSSRDSSLIGAFIALLAVRVNPGVFQFAMQDFFQQLKITIYEFFNSSFNQNKKEIVIVDDIPVQDPALHRFLYCCSELNLSNSDLKAALDWIISNSGAGLIESVTPPEIAKLMVRISGISAGDSVLDPASGTGSFLLAVRSEHVDHAEYTGIEINYRAHFVSCLYKYLLEGEENIRLIHGDAFTVFGEQAQKAFDLVLSNPPVKRVPLPEARYKYERLIDGPYISSELSLNIIEISLNRLLPGGRAIFLVSMGPLFNPNEHIKAIRKHWVDSGYLKAVISLPSKLLSYTSLKSAIIMFERPVEDITLKQNKIKLIKADDCYSDSQNIKRILGKDSLDEIIKRLNHVNDGTVATVVDSKVLSENDYNLVPDRYLNQQIGGVNLSLAKIWKPLEELAQIIRGGSFSKLPPGDDPIIQGRDLRVERLEIDKVERKNLSEYGKRIHRSQLCDILLQRIGNKPAAYFIGPGEDGYAVADTVFIIRFKSTDVELIEFVTQFINSEEGAKKINNAGNYAVVQTQSIKTIRKIEVPVPDLKVVSLVKEMAQIEKALRNEYEKAAQLRKSVFGGFDEADFSTNFNKVRFTSHALENALSQKDDINYKVRNLYPFPVAFPYRNIYTEREYAAIYGRQMKYGELLLSFLASVGISMVFEYRGQLSESIDSLLATFNEALLAGISPGHWRDLLRRSCSVLRNLENLENLDIAAEFSSIWFKGRGKKESVFATATDKSLVQPLNDYKHGRGPANTHEYKIMGKEQAANLKRVLEELEFLIQCEIVLIDDIDANWASGETVYAASLLKGDHPAFERVSFKSEKPLSKEKLYLRYGNDFICLYPLLSYLYNPNTKKHEIFTFDKRTKEGNLFLKSFDSGTSIQADHIGIGADFMSWLQIAVNKNDL